MAPPAAGSDSVAVISNQSDGPTSVKIISGNQINPFQTK